MTRKETIIQNLMDGHAYRKDSASTGISHYLITYDSFSGEFHINTHYERWNPADDGPTIINADEVADHVQINHFHLVPSSSVHCGPH